MATDLCALTDEMLPFYTEGKLAPEPRRRIDDHAAECPACRERLERAVATLAPPSGETAAREDRARRLSARLRRTLLYGLAGMAVLLIGLGGLRYAAARKRPWVLDLIPARVANAEELAARAIPGWNRAKATGLVVDLGVTEKIAATDATITLEKAWYSGREAFILYTVKAPEGGYVLPAHAWLETPQSKPILSYGRTDWHHLSQWGGFSRDGFHGVIAFSHLAVPAHAQSLKLTIKQWGPVTPDAGMDPSRSPAGQTSLLLPWRTDYLVEPAPVVVRWNHQQTWLGRTLAAEQLQVGIGRTLLTGQITLPEGERNPALFARLHVGGRSMPLRDFNAKPAGAPGRYNFTAIFDGVDRWPAPVKLELAGIHFDSDKTLEWPVNYAKYRQRTSSQDGLMEPADRVTIRFYDSELTSIMTTRDSISIEEKPPTGSPPYVRSALGGGSRGAEPDSPGMELVNAEGEVSTNFGGGSGNLSDDGRQGVVAMWDAAHFRASDRLLLRYVYPSAVMVLNETWELNGPR